jgi:hypothetical protein
MVALFAGYLALHFGLYVLVFRHLAAFRRESLIFRYHAFSALASATVAALAVAWNPSAERWAEATLVVGLHGIYSLSFLELWSLAQGGYSLRILMDLERVGPAPDWAILEEIGAAKKANRLANLQRLGLLQAQDGRLFLSRRGRWVAAALAGIVRLINQHHSKNTNA